MICQINIYIQKKVKEILCKDMNFKYTLSLLLAICVNIIGVIVVLLGIFRLQRLLEGTF